MFNMKRNQVIITALVVMIAVAGYLNYTDTKDGKATTASLLLNNNAEMNPLVLDDLGQIDNTNVLTNTEVAEGDIDIALTAEEISKLNSDNSETNTISDGSIEDSVDEAGTAIFVNSNLDDFFIQAKLVREQDRSKQKEIITEIINNDNIAPDQKAKYADEMLVIQKRIEKESAAEAMIEAKGFKEVYVRIDDETVDVVVGKEVLTDAEIAQIEDIVKRKTGMEASQIRISPMKK